MKDLALPDHLPALRAAGVSCVKMEGRKKSPLYVATTTDYYRKLLDGRLAAGERVIQEADLQTVFSRPWTRLFTESHKDKEVADRDTVGHRGSLIGRVEGVRGDRIRFRSARELERHDGLQIDLPTLGKPFGFPIDHLWIVEADRPGREREVFEAPAGAVVEIGLPSEHPPLPVGAPVYCSSSQSVKRRYRHDRPKPGLYRPRRAVAVEVVLTPNELKVIGRVLPQRPDEQAVEVRRTLAGPFAAAQDASGMEKASRAAFEKLGDTRLALDSFTWRNEEGRFVPVSRLNHLRRDLAAGLEQALQAASAERIRVALADICPSAPAAKRTPVFRWSIKVDRINFVDAFEAEDWAGVEELIVDVTRDHPMLLSDQLDRLSGLIGRERIRLALPPLTRKWEEENVRHKVAKLLAACWTKWEAANLSAWSYLGLDPARPDTGALDLSTDWSVYVVNRAAALQLEAMGVPPVYIVARGRPGQSAAAAGGVRRAGRRHRPSGHAVVPGGVVPLRQPDRRLSRQGQLLLREYGNDLQPRRARHRAGLSLSHHRPESRAVLPLDAAEGLGRGGGRVAAGGLHLPQV